MNVYVGLALEAVERTMPAAESGQSGSSSAEEVGSKDFRRIGLFTAMVGIFDSDGNIDIEKSEDIKWEEVFGEPQHVRLF